MGANLEGQFCETKCANEFYGISTEEPSTMYRGTYDLPPQRECPRSAQGQEHKSYAPTEAQSLQTAQRLRALTKREEAAKERAKAQRKAQKPGFWRGLASKLNPFPDDLYNNSHAY